MNKKIIRLTESDLHRIVKQSVNRVIRTINENSFGEGTPKQNAFLKKLMGDRWDDKYSELSVPETSKMIDKELANSNNAGTKYEVVEFDQVHECNSFYEAKKKFSEVMDELAEVGYFNDPYLRMAKVSDICWKVYARNGYRCLGSVFIRKKKQ